MTYNNFGDIPAGEIKHYGVKGMRWGQRKKSDGGSSGSGAAAKKPKITNANIQDARIRQSNRRSRIGRASEDLNLARTERGKKAAAKVLSDAMKEYKDTPDYKTAMRFTTAEKVGLVAVGTLFAPGLGTAAGIGGVIINDRRTR